MAIRKNGHATKARPPRALLRKKHPALTPPSDSVDWLCRAPFKERFLVQAQTWFFARAEASRVSGVEPGKIEVVRW